MMTLALGMLAASGFSRASLLALAQNQMTARGRTFAIAVAGAILLVLALGDLFPESLEMVGDRRSPGSSRAQEPQDLADNQYNDTAL